jgi:cell division transport system permease protein
MNFWTIFYRLRDAREGIARNAWASLATVILITLTLIMLGGFLWLNANLAQLASLLERQVQVRVFPVEGRAAQSLIAPLKTLPGVIGVEVVAGSYVYEQLAPVFGREALMRALPPDAFSDSLSVQLAAPDLADHVVAKLRQMEGVDEIVWGRGFAQSLHQITIGLQRIGALLIGGFVLVAVLISVTAMHLAILNRETEIQIQRWVGVTPWGIRSQFLVEAFLLGLLASVVAGAGFLYAGDIIQRTIAALVPFAANQLEPPTLVVGIILLTGPVLGLIGGSVATQTKIGVGDK